MLEQETAIYPRYSEEALEYLARHAHVAAVHELGHAYVIKKLRPELENTLVLDYILKEEEGKDGKSITIQRPTKERLTSSSSTDPNFNVEEEKLIGASGVAMERLLLHDTPDPDVRDISDTDLEGFADLDEFLTYVENVKTLLAPHKEEIRQKSQAIATIVKDNGPGKYSFKESGYTFEAKEDHLPRSQ